MRLFISWNTCLCLLSVARVIVYFCSTCCLFSITREGNILSLLNLSKFLLLLLFWHGSGCCDGRYRARLSCFHQHFISTFVATGAMPRLAGSPGVDQKFYPISSWTSFICSTMSYQFLLLNSFPFFYYYGLEYFKKISFEIPKG